jgi:hypothetical protein
MGILTVQLSALSAKERPRRRAELIEAAVKEVAAAGSYSWLASSGHKITVSDIKLTDYGSLVLTVAVDGKVLPEPRNPFELVNPPVCVCDKAALPVEDALAALKRCVEQLV